MDLLKKLLSVFNKKGVSATVISIILLVVGLAIVVILIIFLGSQGKENLLDVILKLNQVKHGG